MKGKTGHNEKGSRALPLIPAAGEDRNAAASLPYTAPLGASVDGGYVNFAVFLPHIQQCGLNIYDLDSGEAAGRLSLFQPEERPGLFVGRVKRTDLPERWGYLLFSGEKEFADPYVRSTVGRETFGVPGKLIGVLNEEERPFLWGEERPPRLAYQDMILYKLHVRGFTMTAPGVRHRGTYLGLLEKKKYLLELGVNAVLLLPCEEFDEIVRPVGGPFGAPASPETDGAPEAAGGRNPDPAKGKPAWKINYWGFAEESCHFAPKASYASDPRHAGREFKRLVKGLHEDGIEVLLEMNFRPSDNPNLILDCLIWWVREYHVDGFRISCGQVPVRMLLQHPQLAGIKLLVQNAGDAAGLYPGPDVRLRPGGRRPKAVLAEYSEGFLNEIRRFVKSDEELVGCVAARLERQTGDIGVINYITDNNGFTLRDLYSFDVKHNEENGEENRDGSDYNFSWNCGAEGATKKKKIVRLRAQMQRNALALLFLAQGTPMLLAGDEFGNSQNGNNNAYCQDNETGWVSWRELRSNRELFEFVRSLIALRKAHPVLHNPVSLKGMDYLSCGCPDVSRHGTRAWYPDYSNYSRTLAMLLCGCYAKREQSVSDSSFYFAANMHWEPHAFDLPDVNNGEELSFLFCTDPECSGREETGDTGTAKEEERGSGPRSFVVPPRSVAVFEGKKREASGNGAARGRRRRPEKKENFAKAGDKEPAEREERKGKLEETGGAANSVKPEETISFLSSGKGKKTGKSEKRAKPEEPEKPADKGGGE